MCQKRVKTCQSRVIACYSRVTTCYYRVKTCQNACQSRVSADRNWGGVSTENAPAGEAVAKGDVAEE